MTKKILVTLGLALSLFSPALSQQKPIEFETIFDGTFRQQGISNVRWMNDGKFFSESTGFQIVQNNIVTGEKTVLFDANDSAYTGSEEGLPIQGYQFSADEQKILIRTQVESIWRRSTREHYYVYDRAAKTYKKLTSTEEKQQYAEFSPKGDRVGFVRDNNLFWIDLNSGSETQITYDGQLNSIINGATDWVYEEEFGFAKAWFWSPDGNKIAYYRFDESHVNEFFFTQWGGNYPQAVNYKYPKAGEQNAFVQIGVYDIASKTTQWADLGEEKNQYVPRIKWTQNPDLLSIRRMNRLQNKQDLMFMNTKTGELQIILTEERENGWIDVHDNLLFLKNGIQFMYTSDKDGFNHVYLYDMKGKELEQITKGEWDVTSIARYDEKSHFLYYVSTEVSPLERHFYKVRVDGKRKEKLSKTEGWHSINMSPDLKYYINTHSNYNQPSVYTLYDSKGKALRVLQDNATLASRLNEYAYSEKEFFTLDVNGTTLNAYMIKPPDFDSSKSYPVWMYVYGGPGSQTVSKNFEAGDRGIWHQYLANNGYIIVSVDNRGTGARGRNFKQQTYKKLGVLESSDQVEAAKILAKMPFVDGERIGIWGWSYGGYMSSLSLGVGGDVFKAAISVAPVTHWRYYDTIYTERFMQTPELNPDGYEAGSPLNFAKHITGSLLLIHGTADDNVHFQNAVDLVDVLIREGVQFETMFYPNRNHGIGGGNTRRHLHEMMSNFIFEKL